MARPKRRSNQTRIGPWRAVGQPLEIDPETLSAISLAGAIVNQALTDAIESGDYHATKFLRESGMDGLIPTFQKQHPEIVPMSRTARTVRPVGDGPKPPAPAPKPKRERASVSPLILLAQAPPSPPVALCLCGSPVRHISPVDSAGVCRSCYQYEINHRQKRPTEAAV